MRIGLIILMSLFVLSSLCAFEKGTINPGGSISYMSYKSNADDEDATNMLSIAPQVGYFFIDNLAADLLIDFENMSEGDYKSSSLDIGIGGRYFYKNFYGGLGFMLTSWSWDDGDFDMKVSANYIDLKAGYLVPIVENVYIDLGVGYEMGMGEYGADGEGDNEESAFGFMAGFQIFFPFKM